MRGRGFDSWAVNNSNLFRALNFHSCPRRARLLFLATWGTKLLAPLQLKVDLHKPLTSPS